MSVCGIRAGEAASLPLGISLTLDEVDAADRLAMARAVNLALSNPEGAAVSGAAAVRLVHEHSDRLGIGRDAVALHLAPLACRPAPWLAADVRSGMLRAISSAPLLAIRRSRRGSVGRRTRRGRFRGAGADLGRRESRGCWGPVFSLRSRASLAGRRLLPLGRT
jgi:hypothetical protein